MTGQLPSLPLLIQPHCLAIWISLQLTSPANFLLLHVADHECYLNKAKIISTQYISIYVYIYIYIFVYVYICIIYIYIYIWIYIYILLLLFCEYDTSMQF